MRREKTHADPATEDFLGRMSFESTYVMGPESEAGARQAQPAPQGLGHGFKGALTVASPVDGESLSTGSCRTSEQSSLIVTKNPFDGIKDVLVVQLSIITTISKGNQSFHPLVHLPRVATVVPLYVQMGYTLSEIGLDCVDAGEKELLNETRVPGASFRVGEVNNSHTGLPFVPYLQLIFLLTNSKQDSPLPDAAVHPLDKVTLFDSLFEDVGALSDVRVDPCTYFDVVFLFDVRQVFLRVGERLGVP